MDLNLKSGHLFFNSFMAIFEKSVAGFVGMWENRRFFQVIVGRVGSLRLHTFHNDGISTKLLLWEIV